MNNHNTSFKEFFKFKFYRYKQYKPYNSFFHIGLIGIGDLIRNRYTDNLNPEVNFIKINHVNLIQWHLVILMNGMMNIQY